MIVEKGRSGCKAQDDGVARMSLHGWLGQRQKPRRPLHIGESVEEGFVPSDCIRIPKGKRALRCGAETLARHAAAKTVRAVIRMVKA
ncbi:MAG TPA: hypothetical protein VII40_19495 [Xanthobacteraceae bacterium]